MECIIPNIEDFRVGFEYEQFETRIHDKYKGHGGIVRLEGFELYSDEYFKELHSNDKYWEHRKWVKKIATRESIFYLSSTFNTEKYTPLNIENIFRVRKDSFERQLDDYYKKTKKRLQ